MFPSDSPSFSLLHVYEQLHANWDLPLDAFLRVLHGEVQVDGDVDPSQLSGQNVRPGGCSGTLVTLARRLASFHPNAAKQLQWLTTPQNDFESNTALALMMRSPEELNWVAYYLDTSWQAYEAHQRSLKSS